MNRYVDRVKPKTLRIEDQRGFTLVELLVAIAILSILVAIGVPTFNQVTLTSKLRSYSNEIVASSTLARSEAIKRNAIVTMCVSSDGVNCAADGWEEGWIIFQDTDTDGVVDSSETLIHRQPATDTGFQIVAAVDTLNFQPSGVGATTTSLKVCRSSPSVGGVERLVTISATGRTTVTNTDDGTCP